MSKALSIVVLFLLAFFSPPLAQAGVTCPTGTTYIDSMGQCLPNCSTLQSLPLTADYCSGQPLTGGRACWGETVAYCCPRGQRVENGVCRSNSFNIAGDKVDAETFDALNPLKQFSTGVEDDLTTPGGILTRVLRFAFPLAGLILFVMLIWAGFEIVSGAASGTKSIDAGKQRATAAVVGFILLFISYFGAQLLEVVFGIQIL